MNSKITFHQVTAVLEKNKQRYASLMLQNNVRLILTQHGARIFGPFLTPDSESIFWLNPALAGPDTLDTFLASGNWNLGGERVWIAPEIGYLVRDRTDFWGTVAVPEAMDPGRYELEQVRPDTWRWRQEVSLSVFNLGSGQKELALDRLIHPAPDPLRHLRSYEALTDGLIFAGYEHTISLVERERDEMMSESWDLIQLNPGGQLLIPAAPYLEYSDYFEPVGPEHQSLGPGGLRLKITGDRRYKVGYQAAHVFGRLGYFNRLDDGRAYLLVRNFFNNPAMPYVEEPADAPGRRGHSIHVYNDGGALGGFGELECNGQTIGGITGRSSSTDSFVLWLYAGPADRVQKLIPHLLGLEL